MRSASRSQLRPSRPVVSAVTGRKVATWFLAATVGAAVFGAGCSGQSLKDPDGDEVRTRARPFSRTGPTEDRLNAGLGDLEDWRFFAPERTGTVETRISVGKWEESTIVGFVTVFTEVGDVVIEKPFPATSGTLRFEFPVQAEMRYLVRFRAKQGKGQYAVEVDFGGNSCAQCTDKQDCVDGRCVEKTEKACAGGCPEGSTCDAGKNECVRDRDDKCDGVRCDDDEVCARSTGRCVKKRVRPSCEDNEVLRGGKCVEKVSDIGCSVVDARNLGSGSLLILSCGDNKGVSKGQKGKITGLRGGDFQIVEVYPSRSKAKCDLPPAKIYGHTSAVIKR